MVAAGLLARCKDAPAQTTPVTAWFDCVECQSGELAAVKTLGNTVVPELRLALLNGPAEARVRAERSRLQKAYRDLKDYERRHPENAVPESEQRYVDANLLPFVLRIRVRSARALGAINTPDARAALNEANNLPKLPRTLKNAIEVALSAP